MAKKKSNWFFKFIFVLGFLILMYPQVSRLYYRVQSTQEVSAFDEGKAALSESLDGIKAGSTGCRGRDQAGAVLRP